MQFPASSKCRLPLIGCKRGRHPWASLPGLLKDNQAAVGLATESPSMNLDVCSTLNLLFDWLIDELGGGARRAEGQRRIKQAARLNLVGAIHVHACLHADVVQPGSSCGAPSPPTISISSFGFAAHLGKLPGGAAVPVPGARHDAAVCSFDGARGKGLGEARDTLNLGKLRVAGLFALGRLHGLIGPLLAGVRPPAMHGAAAR